ncbi:MAG: hypothetical protein JHC88_09725 [Niveispirillum sp.]|nr:hypothetical protein [Niveispirillum sp.]
MVKIPGKDGSSADGVCHDWADIGVGGSGRAASNTRNYRSTEDRREPDIAAQLNQAEMVRRIEENYKKIQPLLVDFMSDNLFKK